MKLFNRDSQLHKEEKTIRPSAHGPAPLTALRSAWVTEKAGDLGKLRKYVFATSISANKPQVKAAVEAKYKVKVSSVNVTVNKGKTKRRGGHYGKTSDSKKAIVTLKEGDKIDIMPS